MSYTQHKHPLVCHQMLLSCRLKDELLQCILKTVVRESCLLITKCQTVSKEDLQKLLSTVPVCHFHINAFYTKQQDRMIWNDNSIS